MAGHQNVFSTRTFSKNSLPDISTPAALRDSLSTAADFPPSSESRFERHLLSLDLGVFSLARKSGHAVRIFKHRSLWQAIVNDVTRDRMPVVCAPGRDVGTELQTLLRGSASLRWSRLHVVKQDGGRFVFLGPLGLMGGSGQHRGRDTSETDGNKKQSDVFTPLYNAAYRGHLNAVRSLVRSGAMVDQAVSHGATPLYTAAFNGRIDVVRFLVERGATVDQANNNGATPLFVAAQEGHLDVVRFLVESGATVDQARNDGVTPLFMAAQKDHLDVVRFLVERGATVDQANNNGATPLLVAAQKGHLYVVRFLVERGATVDQANNNGATPLLVAAQEGRIDVVRFLVERGATVDQAYDNGATPLLVAAQEGHLYVVRFLVERGATVDQANNNGATPLFVAAQEGHLDVVRFLVESGATVDQARNDGITPLFVAAQEGHLDVVRFLVESGAMVDQARDMGATPLSIAAEKGHLEVIHFLVESGATVDQANNDGWTPLTIAAYYNHLEIFKYLFNHSDNWCQGQGLKAKSISKALTSLHIDATNQSSSVTASPIEDVSPSLFNLMRVDGIDKMLNPCDAMKLGNSLNREIFNANSKTKIDLNALFSPDDGHSRVIVVGTPGIGKSLLARKLVSDWSYGHWGDQFSNVFLLPVVSLLANENWCHGSNKSTSLAVAIVDICFGHVIQPSKCSQLEAFVQDALMKPTTLVILDGFERSKRQASINCEAIIEQAENGKHKLLTLTRPSGVSEKVQESDLVVEISSLTVEDVKMYLNAQDATVRSHFDQDPKLLEIARNPMQLRILMDLFRASNEDDRSSSLRSTASVYRHLVDQIWKTCVKGDENSESSLRDRAFADLGKIALSGLENGQSIVKEDQLREDLPHHNDRLSMLIDEGLLRRNSHNVPEFTYAILQQYFAGYLLAKWLLEGGSHETAAKECFQREKYTAAYIGVFSMAAAELGQDKRQRNIRKILTSIEAGDKDLFGLQHLAMKMRIHEQWLREQHGEGFDVLEKESPIVIPLMSWLKRGMKEVRTGNESIDDSLLNIVIRLLHNAPSIVAHAKITLLSQVLNEIEKQNWNVNRSIIEALVQVIGASKDYENTWLECMKKGLWGITREIREATIQCVGWLGQFSKGLIPRLLELLEMCSRDEIRDCTMIELIQNSPQCANNKTELLRNICKSKDCRVRRATAKAIPEIIKNAPGCLDNVVHNLLDICTESPRTVSGGVIDVLGMCFKETSKHVNDMVSTLLHVWREMNEEQHNDLKKAFVRVIHAMPKKATEIVTSLLNDGDNTNWSSACPILEAILKILGDIPFHNAKEILDLMQHKHQEREGDTTAMALLLEAIRHVVKASNESLPKLMKSIIQSAFDNNDENIRSLAFCATGAIAKHQPSDLDDEFVDAVIEGCRKERSPKAKLSAFEAASELPPSHAIRPELLSVIHKALGDVIVEVRKFAGKTMKNAAMQNIEERDRILMNLLKSYQGETDNTKHGIVHCLHFLVQEFPETILAVQSVLVDASASHLESLAFAAVSGLHTIASYEHGTTDQLLVPLSRACEREEHSTCFCALDALTLCIRRDHKHQDWLIASLKKCRDPLNNREWLIYLRALEAALENPKEDAKDLLEILLTNWKNKSPSVCNARKEILDRIPLGRLLQWHELTQSDLVVHHISRRLIQTPTVLTKTEDSIKIRVYFEKEIKNYDISSDLLKKLEKIVQSYKQSPKAKIRSLMNVGRRFMTRKSTEYPSTSNANDGEHQSLAHICQKLMTRVLTSKSRKLKKRRLITNNPIDDIGKLTTEGLDLEGFGISGHELEEYIGRLTGIEPTVVNGGYAVCGQDGNIDFTQSIPRHFTERYLPTSLLEDMNRQEEDDPSAEEETRILEYAVMILAKEVGKEISTEHFSRLLALKEGPTQRDPSPDLQDGSLTEEAMPTTTMADMENSVPNALFAGRYILQTEIIPGKDHIKFAYDQQSKEDVVLKFYKSRETFENARDMYNGLDPKYVCRKLGEVEESEFGPCLVFERAQHSLADCLNNKDWEDDAKKPCLHQILMCLDHLNKRDVVHCDVKPSNILFFLSTHSWKLSDFDNARLASWPGPISYSPAYAAPEVLMAQEKGLTEIILASSTDMWSFGIIAYEVLSGKRFYGRKVTLDRVKEFLCDRTQSLPSLEYIEESQIRRLIENLLVFEPGKRWSTKKALDNATFLPADDTFETAQKSQQTNQTVQASDASLAQINDRIDSGFKQVTDKIDSKMEEVTENMDSRFDQVCSVVKEVGIITSRTLQAVESANLFIDVVIEEFLKEDVGVSFETRGAKAALMIRDDYVEDPLFVLRLNDAYRVRISLQHQNTTQTESYKIRAVSVELPDGIKKLEMNPASLESADHEVVALLSPTELDYEGMQRPSRRCGNPEEKYAQLKFVIELASNELMTDVIKVDGIIYCKMVKKGSRLVMTKAIKSVTDLWKHCPQWIRTGARGVVILAKVAIPAIAAATVGDASGAVMLVETAKKCT